MKKQIGGIGDSAKQLKDLGESHNKLRNDVEEKLEALTFHVEEHQKNARSDIKKIEEHQEQIRSYINDVASRFGSLEKKLGDYTKKKSEHRANVGKQLKELEKYTN